jgi:hypothetical protein
VASLPKRCMVLSGVPAGDCHGHRRERACLHLSGICRNFPAVRLDLRYKNHRFPAGIISHGVWLYYLFPMHHVPYPLTSPHFPPSAAPCGAARGIGSAVRPAWSGCSSRGALWRSQSHGPGERSRLDRVRAAEVVVLDDRRHAWQAVVETHAVVSEVRGCGARDDDLPDGIRWRVLTQP